MKTGHRRQMTAGILELVLGIGLILYICLADRQRLVTFCAGATELPAKRKEGPAR